MNLSFYITCLTQAPFPLSSWTGIAFLLSPTLASGFFTASTTWKAQMDGVCVQAKLLQLCVTLWDPMDCNSPGFSVHEDSPGKNTGVGCHALLQGIFITQRLNSSLPCLQHCQQILYYWVTGKSQIDDTFPKRAGWLKTLTSKQIF